MIQLKSEYCCIFEFTRRSKLPSSQISIGHFSAGGNRISVVELLSFDIENDPATNCARSKNYVFKCYVVN